MAKDKSKKASKKSSKASEVEASGDKVVKLKKLTKKETAFRHRLFLIMDSFTHVPKEARQSAAWISAGDLAIAFGRKKVGKKFFKKIAKGLAASGVLPLHIFEHNQSKTSKGFGLVRLSSVMANHVCADVDSYRKGYADRLRMESVMANHACADVDSYSNDA